LPKSEVKICLKVFEEIKENIENRRKLPASAFARCFKEDDPDTDHRTWDCILSANNGINAIFIMPNDFRDAGGGQDAAFARPSFWD